MRKKIIAGNWKMQGTRENLEKLANKIADIQSQADLIVFPPFVFLPLVEKILEDTSVSWGAQNLAATPIGAYTGEVSAHMLREFACRYVLIGHSERRQLFKENNEVIVQKMVMALEAKLIPVLCVGETLAEREAGNTLKVVLAQIDAVITHLGILIFERAIIAYEPIWAIGTGLTASPDQAQEVHAKIRAHLSQIDAKIADAVRILYGGSVKADNASSLFKMPDIDGALVGGASLDAASFAAIARAAG
jgi:triosephosphate isomerase